MQERVLWLLAIATSAVLLLAALRPYFPRGEEEVVPPPPAPSPSSQVPAEISVRVAVLNGCGEAQVAGRLTRKMRALGFDVIYEGNAENFNFLQSMVVDRSGDLERARQVAAALGLPHCIQQVPEDTFRLEEVAVIIGRDYRQVRLLEE